MNTINNIHAEWLRKDAGFADLYRAEMMCKAASEIDRLTSEIDRLTKALAEADAALLRFNECETQEEFLLVVFMNEAIFAAQARKNRS